MTAQQPARRGRTPPACRRAVPGSLAQAPQSGVQGARSSARATSIVSRSRSPRISGEHDAADPPGARKAGCETPGYGSLNSRSRSRAPEADGDEQPLLAGSASTRQCREHDLRCQSARQPKPGVGTVHELPLPASACRSMRRNGRQVSAPSCEASIGCIRCSSGLDLRDWKSPNTQSPRKPTG